MGELAEARQRAIAFEEKKLREVLKSLAETRQEVVAYEHDLEEIKQRLDALRVEDGDDYSSLIFHAELRQHGCLACAIKRAGGENVMTHNGLGPECPTMRGTIVGKTTRSPLVIE